MHRLLFDVKLAFGAAAHHSGHVRNQKMHAVVLG